MKILYLANIRLPTEKAHGAQIMKMCEAFAALGHEVELAVTDRATPISEDPFAYYGIKTRFAITRMPVLDLVGWGRLGFWIESASFARAARKLVRQRSPDLVYGRDELILARLGSTKPLVWETHTGAWNRNAQAVAKRAQKVIAISQGLKAFYASRGVPPEKITVAHDAIDLSAFKQSETASAARRRLALPQEGAIAKYAGRLDGWKGTDTLLEASNAMAPVVLAVIGGEEDQIASARRRYPHVLFAGYRPYRELADNLAAADVLVLPNTARNVISAQFTSPLKLFAYMAAGKPLVVSDLPSIREVVSEEEAYFFEPDSAPSLAAAVRRAAVDPLAAERAARAKAKAARYTWAARANAVLG